jgi:Ca2+-binding RTX toxin-like protein
MPVFALYNFDTASTVVDDAPINGIQNGIYLNGATASGGDLVLDGVGAFAKIYPASQFQMPQGTLEINFTPSSDAITEPQTVLSRDSTGQNQGSYSVQVFPDGSIVVTHETEGGATTFATDAGFYAPGDTINLTYSWDEGGTGGQLVIENQTTGGEYAADVPPALTMDMADQSQPWMIGTSQADSDPNALNNLDDYFEGTVDFFSLSDTVDNMTERDGIVRGTDDGDLIDTGYADPYDGDRIDGNDAIIPGDGPNDDRVVAGGGNDTVVAGTGNDTVAGGEGDDLIDTSGGGPLPLPDIGYPGYYPADADPNNDLDLVYGGAGADTITTGDDADTIHGDGGSDLIDAGIDADLVYAGVGDDTAVGNEGADTIYGEAGDDLIYGGLNDVIGDALDIPDDAGDLRPNNNTDLLYGGEGADTIYGRDDDDTLYGDAGNDVLYGGVDEDTSYGGAGNDTITGGQGADSSAGGADRDVFIVGSGADGVGDFIDGNEEGDDFDTLDLSAAGPLRIAYDPANSENGVVTFLDADGNPTGTLQFVNIENVVPCFTPGTLIATPKGEVPVETLKAGDKVITRDNGIQEIRWMGQKALSGADLRLNSHLQPVLIKAHSLGNGLPEQDMLVSPNHRVLVANDRTQLYFDEHEVLVAAKHLVGTAGVHAINSIGVNYIHFLCDRHEVVLSNGAWTESFQPGDFTLKGMGNAQRNEIFELFPELKTEEGLEGYQSARRTLKRHEARLLTK